MLKNETLSKPIWTRLYEDDLELLNKLASEQSRTISQLIRLIIRFHCSNKTKNKK